MYYVGATSLLNIVWGQPLTYGGVRPTNSSVFGNSYCIRRQKIDMKCTMGAGGGVRPLRELQDYEILKWLVLKPPYAILLMFFITII